MRRIAASIAASLLRQPSGAAATGGLDGLLIGDGEPATRAWLNFPDSAFQDDRGNL
jgi:hypothetical protein